jgi:hypothetical protein
MARRTALLAGLLVVSMTPSELACASAQRPAEPSGSVITEITLERNCFGCPAGSRLVLQRDGAATLTATGNARHGTADRLSRGRVSKVDFDQLIRVLTAQRFFELENEYANPQLQDGDSSVIGVTRAGQQKTVSRRTGAGPPALDVIERAIETVRTRIAWREDPKQP